MPELPEVETIARDLAPKLTGRRIASVRASWARSIDARGLPGAVLEGDTIAGVSRIGKYVAISMQSGRTLAIHLRMTGQLIVDPPAPLAYTRVTARFADGGTLAFADARKFGRWRIVDGDPHASLHVGIDPFDRALTPKRFGELLRKRTTPIKVWLLDQRRLAGIGNIYASEALFDAGIRPRRAAGRLTAAQRARLLRSLRKVLRKAIRHRGSSVDDYVDAEGKQGEFQKMLAVYGRRGMPCRRCKATIRRVVLAQRGTFFCPVCQQ
jgi:formamidopyrimidine-DNA glycosylase